MRAARPRKSGAFCANSVQSMMSPNLATAESRASVWLVGTAELSNHG
jgi:hypothetical protein